MILLLQLFYWFILIQAILRCLYFWQLKEYRFDRFREFLTTAQARQYWLPTRWFLRPKLTFKILVLIYLSLYFSQIILQFNPFWLFLVIAYLSVPLSCSLMVFLLKPLTDLLTDLLVWAAKIKLRFLPQSLIVIGVTGSYGKTSTKEILAHLLAAKFPVCKTAETNNTLIGVALTILRKLKRSQKILVVEMGAYKKGEIKKICQLVKPKIAVITGINSQHLGLFGSQENIISAKSELLAALPNSGLAVLNGANQYTQALAKQFPQLRIKLYSRPKKVYATNLLGNYQQLNIAAAVQIARQFKIPRKLIISRLATIPAFKTMMVKKIGLNHSRLIDDSYNANFDSFMEAINLVAGLKFKQKILISSGIIELGQQTKSAHEQIFQSARKVFTKIFITKAEIARFFPSAIYEPNPKKITQQLKSILNAQTIVLLESRLPQKFIKSLCLNQS